MQQFIFDELRKYADSRLGAGAWERLLALAAPQGRSYEAGQNYPDSELVAILRVACETSGLSHGAMLEDFGAFLAPDLLENYHAFIKPGWKTLDLLEYTEVSMHAAVRMRDEGASPPGLTCKRVSADEVAIVYSSPRRLCPLAKGIIAGIAGHYGESIQVTESKCMHRGDPQCLLSVRLLP